MFSMGMRARLAPLSMATCRGSTSDRTGLTFPWTLMSPSTSRPGCGGALRRIEYAATKKATPSSAFDLVPEEINDLDVEVRGIHLAADAEGALVCEQVAEGTVDRLLHGSRDTAGRFELAGSGRDRDLDAIHAHSSIATHRRTVDGARSQRVWRNQIFATLLRNANELLLTGLADLVAERGLVVLEGAHLLELLLDPAASRDT